MSDKPFEGYKDEKAVIECYGEKGYEKLKSIAVTKNFTDAKGGESIKYRAELKTVVIAWFEDKL